MEVLVGKCGGELKGLFVCVHWWGGEVGEVRGGERLLVLWLSFCLVADWRKERERAVVRKRLCTIILWERQ